METKKQPPLLVIWGKYDLSFDLSEPQAYRRDVPNAHVHVLDASHFALDTAADMYYHRTMYTPSQFAKKIGVSVKTIQKWDRIGV